MFWPALYGALAALAGLVVWRDAELRMVGVMLAVSWLGSNLAGVYLAPSERPAVYTVLEIVVSLMAYFAWVGGKSRALIGLLAVSAVSIAANIALAAIFEPTREQVRLWQIATNICFGLECLLAVVAGVRARGGIGRRLGDHIVAAPPGAAARTRRDDR